MKTLLLIDISNLFWASWHATADLEASAAFDKTLAKVAALCQGHDLIAVACDAPPYDRKKLHPEYKAQRDKPSEVAVEQFRRVKARLEADGLLLWSHPGAEADDVIATATKHALLDGLDVLIASSDKDLLQLVGDHVQARSLATDQLFDREAVLTKFGCTPESMVDLLSLMGDKSDNVPGAPGVGPKTAAELLMQFGDLDGVLANVDKITKPKLQESIFQSGDALRLARKLITLRDDVPIEWKAVYERREPKKLVTPEPEAPAEEPKSEPRAAATPEPAKPSTALAKTGGWEMQLEPADGRGAWVLAEKLYNSRLYSKFGCAEAIFAILLRGRALGMDATLALDSFHVIEGKPSMSADLIEALVLRSGKAEYFELVETTLERATYATKRRGGRREVTITFTVEDAFNAQLVERNAGGLNGFRGVSRSGRPSAWDKYRSTMLRARAKTQLARAVYPDVTLGLYTPDEVSDGQAQILDAEFEAA